MTSSKVHKNVTRWNFFLKIDIIEPWAHSTLFPICDKTLLYNNFAPVEDEIAPKKNLLPLFFSETTVLFLNFFHHGIRFDWGHK